ncbi:hypothetical protein O0L34_g10167 [Tuta absoluta]|nr:hypothetical protein O0L34_g10167 [Tuta absoluta]
MESEKVKLSAFLVQGLATLSIASIACLTGITFSWPSYTVDLFASNETVLSYPMSSMEVSIFGSIPNIGALVATPFCGYAMDKFGRKKSAMLFGLPFVLAWLTISLTTNVPLVIAAVGFAGLGVAGQAGAAVYVAEIAQDSIRGGLSSCIVAGLFVGLLTSYTIGGQLTYSGALYANLSLSILYMVGVSLLKESPSFLMQKGKEEEAAKSLAFYRQVKPDSKEVGIALRKIKMQLGPQIDQKLYAQNDDEPNEGLLTHKPPIQIEQTESPWKFLRKSESSKRALFASLTLMISNTLMGAIVLQVYAEPLFSEAVPSMSPNLCSILLAVAFLLSVISCALIVDRFGRKFLMTTTSIASGVLTFLIGAQLVWHFAPHWCTALFIYSFSYINYLGAATVPFIFMAEVFLPEVRGLGNSITMASLWTTNFVTLIAFNPLVEAFGLGPMFFGFSTVCFGTSVYSHFCLPETKGMSADQIQLLFIKKKRNSIIA